MSGGRPWRRIISRSFSPTPQEVAPTPQPGPSRLVCTEVLLASGPHGSRCSADTRRRTTASSAAVANYANINVFTDPPALGACYNRICAYEASSRLALARSRVYSRKRTPTSSWRVLLFIRTSLPSAGYTDKGCLWRKRGSFL